MFKDPKTNKLFIFMRSGNGIEGLGQPTGHTDITLVIKLGKDNILDLVFDTDPIAPE